MPLQKSLKQVGRTIKDTAAELLPPMRVELLSDREAVVDGCRGILEYSECCIRLCAGALTVRFTGGPTPGLCRDPPKEKHSPEEAGKC